MKESQFNMHRFLLVAKRDIMEDWKGNLTKGIGNYALYTIIMISLFINSHGMKFHDFIANMAEWILLFTSIVFIFVSSDVLSPLSSKAKRISFLNLPATNLEKFVWRFLYVSIGFLAINLAAIILLGKYAFRLLEDYRAQKRNGIKDPVFTADKLPEIERELDCWHDKVESQH